MTPLLIVVLSTYLFILIWLSIGSSRIRKGRNQERDRDTTRFSIIIPFRNEEKRITPLLESIISLEYPPGKFEVVLVDDQSTDDTTGLITRFFKDLSQPIAYRLLSSIPRSNAPKKDALLMGISKATGDWILTTDADCILPKDHLNLLDSHILPGNSRLIAGQVGLVDKPGLLGQFQQLDNVSLQLTTMGGFGWKKPFMCNGANLAFERSTFLQVDGYAGNDHLPSGDDVFLLEKIHGRFPGSTSYLPSKDSMVLTHPATSWKELITQRVRWASKTTEQDASVPKIIGISVLATNLIALVIPVLVLLEWTTLYVALWWLLIKFVLDLSYLAYGSWKLQQAFRPFWMIISWLIYPMVLLSVIVLSGKSSCTWRGRRLKKID